MLRIRLVEETIAQLYHEQEMRCPVHLSIGQEAVAVGACAAISRQDYAMSGHRSHAHYLAKGGSLPAMMAEIYGKVTGCCRGKGGSMHLIDRSAGFLGAVPIVGSTIPIAVGTALTAKMQGASTVSLAFFGEGATEEGVFHESMNFASLLKLPIVFVCENNLYSVYTPLSSRQPSHREVFAQAGAHGVEGHRADGNDLPTVYQYVREAVAKARRGEGPTFLEFETYRWREHCGPNFDNDIGYRSPEEYELWKTRCPLNRARQLLTTQGALEVEQEEQWRREITEEIQSAVQFAKASPFPAKETLTTHLFA